LFSIRFFCTLSRLSKKKTKQEKCGAFQPVIGNSKGCSPTPIGEKRRWESRGFPDSDETTTSPIPPSPIASRTRGALLAAQSEEEVPRAVLTARRTRVKVIYHDPTPRPGLQVPKKSSEIVHNVLSESPPNNPSLKRGRHSSTSKGNERPSLNFDKMREQIMQFEQPDAENMPFSRSSPSAASPHFSTD
jgi:hypothetical protein